MMKSISDELETNKFIQRKLEERKNAVKDIFNINAFRHADNTPILYSNVAWGGTAIQTLKEMSYKLVGKSNLETTAEAEKGKTQAEAKLKLIQYEHLQKVSNVYGIVQGKIDLLKQEQTDDRDLFSKILEVRDPRHAIFGSSDPKFKIQILESVVDLLKKLLSADFLSGKTKPKDCLQEIRKWKNAYTATTKTNAEVLAENRRPFSFFKTDSSSLIEDLEYYFEKHEKRIEKRNADYHSREVLTEFISKGL